MDRRTFITRVAAWAAALGTGIVTQAQRVSQPVLNRLEYVLSREQEWCTLMRLDGTQVKADQIRQVLVRLNQEQWPGHDIVLRPGQYSIAGQGWNLKLGEEVMRWNAAGWVERIIVEHGLN